MRTSVFLSILLLIPPSGLRAEDGCDKASEACKPRAAAVTPFMAALTNAAQPVPALKQGAVKEPSLKQGGPKAQLVPSAVPAAPPQSAPDRAKTVSHPAWLPVAAALLAGLYYFLRERKKRRKG
ncbi:MAG: hypothetical protein WCW52_09245 [Elusimicrobiales bacterium]